MKYLLLLPFLLLLACGQSQPAPASAPAYSTVDVTGAAELMEEEVVILDVRTPAEIARGKIAGALEIDYRDPDFATKLAALDREPTYLVYCAVGGRSSRACQLMVDAGFGEVYNLEGGYTAWSRR